MRIILSYTLRTPFLHFCLHDRITQIKFILWCNFVLLALMDCQNGMGTLNCMPLTIAKACHTDILQYNAHCTQIFFLKTSVFRYPPCRHYFTVCFTCLSRHYIYLYYCGYTFACRKNPSVSTRERAVAVRKTCFCQLIANT